MYKFIRALLVSLIVFIILGLILAIDWIAFCGILKLICLCFNIKFSWINVTIFWFGFMLLIIFYRLLSNHK